MPRRAAPMPSADEMSDCITGGSAPEASAAAPAAPSGDWYGNFPDDVRDMSADLEIVEAEVLGEGSESTVYLGKVTPGGQKVAAKVVKIRGYDDLKRFKREMAVLAALAPHPHVACLVGADPTPGRRTIVLPFAEMGDLATLIHDRGVQLGADLALCYALQVADALQHVHARGFVHKDVKSANCLVSGDWRSVCLSDFGLADQMHAPGLTDAELRAAAISGNRGPTGGVQRVRIVGTLVSLAPEVLGNQLPSPSSDVYSWSILANEILSSAVPYSDRLMSNPKPHTILDQTFNQAELMQAICKGLRPVAALGVPEWAGKLLASAWGGDAAQRPTAGECAGILRGGGVGSVGEGMVPKSVVSVGSRREGEVASGAARTEEGEKKGSILVAGWEPALKVGHATFLTAGRRGEDRMEDCTVVETLDGGVVLFGVFDGHGGPEVSAHASENLRSSFLCSAGQLGSTANPGQVLAAALEQLEAEVIGMASVTSGSTALAGCIVGSHMWLANLGDCRAVSCEEGGIIKRLTADQVCGLDSERAAIEARGGRVENGRVNGKIEVSRTLGDRGLKPPLGCAPEVTKHDCSSMQWALAASDGLWEVVTDEEAMGVIKDTVKTPDLLAKRIVMHAIDPRGSMDNISCIVFVFGDLCGACERIF